MKWTSTAIREHEMPRLPHIIVGSLGLNKAEKFWVDEVIDYQRYGRAIYVAIERTFSGDLADRPKETSAIVIPIRFEEGRVFWKWLHESMGPTEMMCPERILNRLTPATSLPAQDWRHGCRLNLAKAWFKHGIPEGFVIATESPVGLPTGEVASLFCRSITPEGWLAMETDGQILTILPKIGFPEGCSVWHNMAQYQLHGRPNMTDPDIEEFIPWFPWEEDFHEKEARLWEEARREYAERQITLF